MEPFIIVLIVLIVAPVAWVISTYNKFIKYKNMIEEEIQQARNRYNLAVRKFNTLVESFPSSLIARKFGFERRKFFSLELATQRELPAVNLTGPPS